MRSMGASTRIASLAILASAVAFVAVLEMRPGAATVNPSALEAVASSLSGSPLVVPDAESLIGGQRKAAADAARANPEAAAARERSRTAYARLTADAVGRLLSAAFPAVVRRPANGAPTLPSGARVIGYPSSRAVQLALPGHRRGVVESFWPLAKRTSHGRFAPLDLTLTPSGAGYAPARSAVTVQIPKSLSAGITIPGDGVTVTPVDSHGQSVSGEGAIDHASVVYANTQPATDTVAKPTPTGFQLDAVLRSADSPQELYFKVGAPASAKLVQDPASGIVRVVSGGSTIATVLPPAATDVEGMTVPASMRLAGDTVVVDVGHRTGSYLYPIDVDPEVNDSQLATTSGGKRSNWEFHTSNSSRFAGKAVYEGAGKEHLETKGIAEYAATEWAYWGYETKGNSKIYELKTKTSAKNKLAKIESFLEFEAPGGSEKPKKMLSNEFEEPEYSEKASTICAWNASKVEECLPTAGKEKNAVHFQQSATAAPGGNYGFLDSMSEGVVSISEPAGTHSTTSYNTTSPELVFEVEVEGKKETIKRKNALYGSGSWLSKFEGALELIAKDPGIGVAATKFEYESSAGKWTQLSAHEYLEKENGCQGVQCYATHSEFWTLDPKLPDGEQKIRYRAEEAMAGTASLESEGQATVKVDGAAPHRLHLNGLPYGNELSEKPYELTGEATDGEGSTVPSSGIKSIALYIDGRQFGTAGGSCSVPKGECTASTKWTVNGAELGAGHHAIVLVVFDNAGNEARLEKTISIRHSTPVALGPGSVDLESGDFTLGGSDVSMGSGLTVGHNYSSRDLTSGNAGPLGGPWNLAVGSTESLVELVDGGVLMTAGNGSQTIFAPLSGGKFESPTGDSNLELSVEENPEKQKLAYYLKDNAKHTSVKFTRPTASSPWVPSKQEGTVATDTVTYTYQASENRVEYLLPDSNAKGGTVGYDGNIWFVEEVGDKVVKVTPTGKITEYAITLPEPQTIAEGPDGNVWYTSKWNEEIDKMTPAGVVTKYFPGSRAKDIAAGPDGNMWYTDYEKDKVVKLTTTGTHTAYAVPAGSKPDYITAGPDGNVWFSDYGTSKIGKITPSGGITEYALPAGSHPTKLTAGPDGKIWFIEEKNKVGKMSTTGALTEYSVGGGFTENIVAGSDGNIWVAENQIGSGPRRVWKLTTSGVATKYNVPGAEGGINELIPGPDKNIWYVGYFKEGSVFHDSIGIIPTSGVTVEPTQELAPKPSGVSCEPELKPGCRALKFKYATATTATGEGPSEWGEFGTRLTKVLLDAYEPVSKTMQETAVAEYSYDKLGRLRAEWDPRVSPALKTTYGYDEEGHVTAMNPPGQESWAFTYGTSAGDSGSGRLVKLTRPSASTALWNGEAVKTTGAPKILGTAYVGTRLLVEGTYSGSPIAYGYQWYECNSNGDLCVPITGATNQNYVPKESDVGHKLMAVITVTNGGGSDVSATAVASKTVTFPRYTEYTLPTLSRPYNITAGPDGKMWFTELGTEKVAKISMGEGAITEYATNNDEPEGIAKGPDGNVWFVEHSVRHVCHITPSGTLTTYTLTRTSTYNVGITKGPDENLWFTESESKYIAKINSKNEVLGEYLLPAGSKPYSIVSGPDGNLWFTEFGTSKIGKITTSGVITEYALPAGSKPYGITSGPDGNLWFTDNGTNKVGKITTAGVITEYALAEGSGPRGIASWTDGKLYVAEFGTSKIAQVTTAGVVSDYTLSGTGAQPNDIANGPDGNLWVTEYGTGKILRFDPTTPEGEGVGGSREPQIGYAINYGVPLSGSGLPTMTSGEVAKWGQKDDPVEATAIIPPDSRQGWPASSYTRASLYYLDENGRTVNVSSPSTATYGSIATTEYNELNDVVRTLSPDNRQTALEAGGKSAEVAKLLDTQSTYNGEGAKEGEVEEPGTRLIETLGPQHEVKYMEGSEQRESLARLHTKYFYDEGAPTGETYDLVTKTTVLAQLANEEEREVRHTTTSYSGQSNLGWKLRAPTSVTVDPEGKKITTTTFYNATTGQVTETRGPLGGSGGSARDRKLIYYSAEANTEGYASCGNHPEWAGLVCETLPAKQPEAGTPALPVITTTAYNIWNEPETATETFGSTTRTKKETYDGAGRLSTSETTSSADVALPKVTNAYNAETGVLEKQSTTVEEKTKTITSKYNKLGEMTEYTDADGNTSKYTYGGPENDWLLEEVADGSNEGTGRQIYAYNATTKLLEKLWDSAAGTFTASYDAEGKLTSEVYPNAMCANESYNSAGEAAHIEYIKTSNCSESGAPVWYSETLSPSVRGEVLDRTSTLANERYTYDTLGRLTEAQETPTGEGCSERLYAYDDESNRTSQTTRAPGGEGKCATGGGTVLTHSYDEANRLKDSGVAYDSFGNVTKLPAADAEGHELSSTFYVDNAVATQSQNGVTHNYYLDPEGRARETVTGSSAAVNHYDGPGEAVAWTSEGTGKGTRNIPGVDGTLSATQTNGETPILQLHDLRGDIVATASLSTEATKVLSTYNSTEFGVPNGEKAPPKFAWLGAGDIASAFSSGVITYGSTSYVPQTGRALQSEEVEPPGLPGGSGAGAAYTSQEEPWNMQGAAREGAEAPGLEAAREQAALEAALSVVDPEHWTVENLEKSRKRGQGYLELESVGEVLSFFGLPDEKTISEIAGKIAGEILSELDSAFKWLNDAGEKLIKCSKNNRKLYMCGFWYDENEVTVPILGTLKWPHFTVEPHVWECQYEGRYPSGAPIDTCYYEVHITNKEL